MRVLAQHKLCGLNTWFNKAYTYEHPQGRSQIDYVLVRRFSADGIAKQCKPEETILAGWRSAGHLPLRASIKLRWRPWQHGMRNQEQHGERQAMPAGDIQDAWTLSELQLCLKADPAPPPVKCPTQPHIDVSMQIQSYWRLRRTLMRTTGVHMLRACFQVLQRNREMHIAHRQLKREVRHAKRTRILKVLAEAELAAQRGDTRSLYQYVRQLAPRDSAGRLRLRDKDGNLMTPAQECKHLTSYAKQLFTGEPFAQPPLLPLPESMFCESEWIEAFSMLKTHKAVPANSASVASWKSHVNAVSPKLEYIALHALTGPEPRVPDDWLQVHAETQQATH